MTRSTQLSDDKTKHQKLTRINERGEKNEERSKQEGNKKGEEKAVANSFSITRFDICPSYLFVINENVAVHNKASFLFSIFPFFPFHQTPWVDKRVNRHFHITTQHLKRQRREPSHFVLLNTTYI